MALALARGKASSIVALVWIFGRLDLGGAPYVQGVKLGVAGWFVGQAARV